MVTALAQAACALQPAQPPGKEVLILNHSSIDPEPTGKSCSFWHFMFDANTAMRMQAIANYIEHPARDPQGLSAQPGLSPMASNWASFGRMHGARQGCMQSVGETLEPHWAAS